MADHTPPEVQLEYEPGKKGRGKLAARLPDGTSHVDRIDIFSVKARKKFARELCEGRPGLDEQEIVNQLHTIAGTADRAESTEACDDDGAEQSGRRSTATQLVDLVRETEGVELFHNAEKEAFVTLPVGDHRETWKVHSKGVREWLSRRFYLQCGRAAGSQAVNDAASVLAGIGKYEGPELPVSSRIAGHDGDIWIDLGGESWDAVRVHAGGWEIVPSSHVPVRFVRKRGMQALPTPVHGGSVEELRPLVNLDDDQFTLAMGWLIGAFRPQGPYAVLSVCGEQGSAKSTVCKLLRRLVDPNVADLRRPPKDERDVFIAGSNAWVFACNNVSGLRAEISDALCALATDGGFATRTLYENDDETVFSTRRPVILNGIEEPAARSDLVDRAISLMLRRIGEEQRLDEDDVMARYEAVRPRVLGALLTAVSAALRNRSSVTLTRKPRMADLATWVTAAEEGLGWPKESFIDAYMGNRSESNVDVVEASPIGAAILLLTQDRPFVGTAGELLKALNQFIDNPAKPPADWPRNTRALGSVVRRLAPNLRGVGMIVDLPGARGKGHHKRREFRLERHGPQRSAWPASSATPDATIDQPAADHPDTSMARSEGAGVHDDASPCANADRADHADHRAPACSDLAAACGPCGPSPVVADHPNVDDEGPSAPAERVEDIVAIAKEVFGPFGGLTAIDTTPRSNGQSEEGGRP